MPPTKQNAMATHNSDQRHRWQRRVFQVGPGTVQPSRGRRDFCGEPEIERQRPSSRRSRRRRARWSTKASIHVRISLAAAAALERGCVSRPRRIVPVMVWASGPRVSSRRHRGQGGKARSRARCGRPDTTPAGATGGAIADGGCARSSEQREISEPPGGQGDPERRRCNRGAEDDAETVAAMMPPMQRKAGPIRAPPSLAATARDKAAALRSTRPR